MRLGISSALSHSTAQEWAEKHIEAGCKSVVFPVDSRCDKSVIKAYADAADKAGLVIAEVGIWNNVLAKNPDERRQNRDYAVAQLKMADEIGAVCCVNIAGAMGGSRWDGGCRANFSCEAWDETVSSVREIIDSASPQRTYFCIESMPWMIPASPDDYVRLIEAVDRERFAAHLDVVNMITSPEKYYFNDDFLRGCFSKLHGKICSCHLKDIRLGEEYTLRLEEVRCGDGTLDIELYARLADNESKDMPMIIEHLATEKDYLESLAYVRNRLAV